MTSDVFTSLVSSIDQKGVELVIFLKEDFFSVVVTLSETIECVQHLSEHHRQHSTSNSNVPKWDFERSKEASRLLVLNKHPSLNLENLRDKVNQKRFNFLRDTSVFKRERNFHLIYFFDLIFSKIKWLSNLRSLLVRKPSGPAQNSSSSNSKRQLKIMRRRTILQSSKSTYPARFIFKMTILKF